MFKRITRVDELIRRGIRPKPIISVPTELSSDEGNGALKISHLGHTTRLKGDLSLDENLCIDGTIEGTITIRGKQLSVSPKASIKGEVHARTVEVRGAVEGDIHGEELVHLHSTAAITGSVYCKRIVVDDGARFNGSLKTAHDAVKSSDSRKTLKPLKVAAKPADSPPELKSVTA